MTMDIASLMWDETGRDYDGERREMSRTAALADAERLVGEFVYRADSGADLTNRLALAQDQLRAVAVAREYPLQYLTADLTQRWQLLSTARAAAEQQKAASRTVTAVQERAMDAVTARLAALAARENPAVPMAECLKLASEAVRKHADAYPLAYESWGGTGDGPFTDRAKHWQPPKMPKPLPEKATGPAADPGPNGGAGTFDSVHQRLDGLEERLNTPSSAAKPPTTASLDPVAAGMWQRLKNWWGNDSAPADHPAPDLSGFDRAHAEMKDKWDANLAGPGASADYTTRHQSDDLLHGFDQARSELDKKWDANAASPGASPEYTTQHASDDLLHGFDKARGEMNEKWDKNLAGPGASKDYRPPVPSGFSHTDSGHGTGQQALPTDPAEHGFSHADTSDTPHQRQDWNIPTHFQYGASLFE